MSAALQTIKDEGTALIRAKARREPAKIIALKAGIKPRHAYNLRDEALSPELGWPHFLMLAMDDPQLRSFVARILGLDPLDPERKRLLKQLASYAASVAEEGDQA